ncbi:MAG: DUF4132 domain-containing protein [Lachnospiraceae bacterium]|nr:DUF4132 domain-containing protein [Lachnospiraceae bacterium]
MAGFDYISRMAISKVLRDEREKRLQKLPDKDMELAQEILSGRNGREQISRIIEQFYSQKEKKPSHWFTQQGAVSGSYAHGELLDAFVPQKYQESYLYIIDKLNQFPFSRGWQRRTVRTNAYWAQIDRAFNLLTVYEKLFYCGENLEDIIYRRLDEEKMDYIGHEWGFTSDFSLIYAAEIDRGNRLVIDAFKELILSENNAAYLDREMILGILRSDNRELHKLVCDLLLAARLQEGLRQAICEVMDEGTKEAFMGLLKVIEDNDLIRYSSVKRSVAVWIGIFNETSVDRVTGKLLGLMGQCLRDENFCREQLKSNDSIAISVALWALGFDEVENEIRAMMELIEHGTRNQKLTASYCNNSLYNSRLKIQVAKKVVMEHTDDLELVAAFMPAFNTNLGDRIKGLLYKDSHHRPTDIVTPQKPVLTEYFKDRAEAELQYKKLLSILDRLPKKGVLYEPCIFPWHRVEMKPSEIVRRLAFLAYVLEDEEKITKMAELLGEVSRDNGYYSDRAELLNLLLYCPTNKAQRELLITYMGNAEELTSNMAVEMVKKLTLQKEDYYLMEDMLRFKRSKLRNQLLEFLASQEEEDMEECLKRLLKDKNEEKRSAGLDLILRMSKAEGKESFYSRIRTLAEEIQNPTDKEKVMLEEILGENNDNASSRIGYGIYNPEASEQISVQEYGNDALMQCVTLSEQEIIDKLKKLDAVFKENKDYEYDTADGEKKLLANGYSRRKIEKADMPDNYYERKRLKYYPLEQELRDFYEKEIGSYSVFIQMDARILWDYGDIHRNENAQMFYKSVFGKCPFKLLPLQLEYTNQVKGVMDNYRYEFLDKGFLFETGVQAVSALGKVVSRENKNMNYEYVWHTGQSQTRTMTVGGLRFINRFMEGLGYWETDEEFTRAFYTAWNFELKCAEDREKTRFHSIVQRYDYNIMSDQTITPITPYWFLKAYHMGLISRDIMFKAVLNYFDRRNCLRIITQLVKGEYERSGNVHLWRYFFGDGMAKKIQKQGEELVGKGTWCGKLIQEMYDAIVPVMLDTELRRGEAPTEFSMEIGGITYIRGTDYLIRILRALGNDTLERETWMTRSSWGHALGNHTKKEVLCYLLKASYPAQDDNGTTLKQRIKGTSIKADRLVEVAMYAPQWIDVIEDYLGWKGLKSGCYYFMAHMDEYFSDEKKAMIARYTPLSAEELQNGAFDIDWFNEVYAELGEKNFALLYRSAKYISNGQKHARARKYADAAVGKVTTEELREQITVKRNKDLLMSYGLVPFAKERDKDLLERYHFIRQYAKEAKQFGAQRRVSEAEAAQTALVNMSVHAGFSDVTRLILKMESRIAQEYAPYREWHAVEDVEICLNVDEAGKSSILCRKDGQMLKSVPTRLKNKDYLMEVKEVNKKLKEQYTRTKKMMEESMESGEEFTASEIIGLMENDVVSAILKPLVFIFEENMGFAEWESATGLVLKSWDGKEKRLMKDDKLRIAHPLDLYRAGVWHSCQKYLFDNQICQPFKQVFRELYVKMPEELGLRMSRMFAGNQIQPGKTVGCLKSRRWVADYEEGLQKIYYKENIVARIYALADWFSPSDTEEPTLEWVEFSNRKTFETLTIEQVPDLIYSEVMRDVDLAVSVAHAGGVDPETSHSTIEMRRAIVEFNLPLFKLENVTLKDSHALIHGTRGNYNVHLGSGVVHQESGAMLNILPVHSQRRGKLFLPFVDEDPKTAEIMSKIVLLAEDSKIRDPFILDQIGR